jgi:hypothetical protein
MTHFAGLALIEPGAAAAEAQERFGGDELERFARGAS